jgi:diguanylate cyclase (GGDEF)-like protein
MRTEPVLVLLIEDNPGDIRLIRESLAEAGAGRFELHNVERLESALKLLGEENFDVILLDLSLPDSSGMDTVKRMDMANLHTPIIVLTAVEDDTLALEAVQYGVQDYLIKGQVNSQVLVRAMHYAIERYRTEQRLQYMATHDELTNMPNRVLFRDRLIQAIERARRNSNGKGDIWETAVMLLDLDEFKSINDTLGHAQGDILLQAVANRLQQSVRKSDTVARMGGDEFTLIFENLTGQDDTEILASKILAVFARPFEVAGHELKITASIGVSLYPFDANDAETLLRHADIAMYQAKKERNTYKVFYNSGDAYG